MMKVSTENMVMDWIQQAEAYQIASCDPTRDDCRLMAAMVNEFARTSEELAGAVIEGDALKGQYKSGRVQIDGIGILGDCYACGARGWMIEVKNAEGQKHLICEGECIWSGKLDQDGKVI